MSAAIFADPDKVEFIPLNTNVRFQAVQSGEVDVLSRQNTWSFSRDASLGLDFGPVVFYDGQGLMVSAKLNVKSAGELADAAICLLPGTTTLQNLEDFFRPRNIKYESVVFEELRNSGGMRSSMAAAMPLRLTVRTWLPSRHRQRSFAICGPARDDLEGASCSDGPPERSELARYPKLVRL